MKGWPLLRAALVFCLLLLAGLPLRWLTAAKIVPPAVASVKKMEKVSIVLTFTQPPRHFALRHLGVEILSEKDPTAFTVEKTVEIEFPKEGIDLVFEGKWTPATNHAGVIVEVSQAGKKRQSKTLSGGDEIFEVVTFTGEE